MIGGGEIYSQTLSDCSEIFLTEVLCEVPDGDAFFPDITDSFVVAEILDENEDFILRRWVRIPNSKAVEEINQRTSNGDIKPDWEYPAGQFFVLIKLVR